MKNHNPFEENCKSVRWSVEARMIWRKCDIALQAALEAALQQA